MTTRLPDAESPASVRPAERADLLAVVRIEQASFPQPWPYDAFEQFLDAPGFQVAVVESGGTADDDPIDVAGVAGYVVADVVPNHGRGIGHVKNLAVHPDRRGRGIGSTLLARSLSTLRAEGARTAKLEVRERNDSARSLYRAFGFEPLRRIPRYYDDGENAVIMVREL